MNDNAVLHQQVSDLQGADSGIEALKNRAERWGRWAFRLGAASVALVVIAALVVVSQRFFDVEPKLNGVHLPGHSDMGLSVWALMVLAGVSNVCLALGLFCLKKSISLHLDAFAQESVKRKGVAFGLAFVALFCASDWLGPSRATDQEVQKFLAKEASAPSPLANAKIAYVKAQQALLASQDGKNDRWKEARDNVHRTVDALKAGVDVQASPRQMLVLERVLLGAPSTPMAVLEAQSEARTMAGAKGVAIALALAVGVLWVVALGMSRSLRKRVRRLEGLFG